MRMKWVAAIILAAVLGMTTGTGIRAEILPRYSIREMTIQADLIVVGEPVYEEEDTLPLR